MSEFHTGSTRIPYGAARIPSRAALNAKMPQAGAGQNSDTTPPAKRLPPVVVSEPRVGGWGGVGPQRLGPLPSPVSRPVSPAR